MYSTVKYGRVKGREAYTSNGDHKREIAFLDTDSTVIDDAGNRAVVNAAMSTTEKLRRGSFIARDQVVYRISGIKRGVAGDNIYFLKEVGTL